MGFAYGTSLESLCDYYKSLGIAAMVLPKDSPEGLETGRLRQDMGYIAVRGRNFDLVTIRFSGAARGGSSSSTSAGGVPISSKQKQKLPVEYHHIVKTDPSAHEAAYKARLKSVKKGLFKRQVVDLRWEGQQLASMLNADAEMNRRILGFITPDDGFRVDADRKNRCIRVVFSRPVVLKTEIGLLKGFKFERDSSIPDQAVSVVDEIAGLVRRIPS